jgi:hypothetical protein
MKDYNFFGNIPIVGNPDANTITFSQSVSPNKSNILDLQGMIDKIKAEITEHAQKERKEFLNSVLEDLKENCNENVRIIKEEWTGARDKVNNFITEKVNEEIEQIGYSISVAKTELTEHADIQFSRLSKILDGFRYLCESIDKKEIDIIKTQITAHADEEIARLQAVSKDLEESMTEKFVEELVDAKKEIWKATDTEIERIRNWIDKDV